ncbi:fumarylacetoacetate hydrolase domain-containing protein 2-like [Saccostrea cucullata]|uniref:fumarylacetoacetate hydrolase domain-containing protein 2-like n=1 Tax=Saccostrea cuccullata TaxID=36930 RepID=UPI002ED49B11
MRFVQFLRKGNLSLGVELKDGGDIVDLCAGDSKIPPDLRSFIERGEGNLRSAQNLVEKRKCVLARDSVKIVAPISNPEKVVCVGMNYRDHCEEQNAPVPVEPVVFNKFPSSIIGPSDDLEYPMETQKLDWEAELAFVIGKEARCVEESNAMEHIFGFTVALDASARDWQIGRNGGQVLLGKAMDGFCPLGPAIVTKDEIGDPHNLGIRCKVNGIIKQNSNTNQLVHKSAAIIAHISRFLTLKPGDVVLTGTPPGVGFTRNPPEFLQRGDVVQCEIDGIGSISNRVV